MQINSPARNDDTGGEHGNNNNDSDGKMIRKGS